MPQQRILDYLAARGVDTQIRRFADTHSAELAAQAVGVAIAQISKSLVFAAGDQLVLVMVPGDCKVDQKRLRELLRAKPRMADPDQVLAATGYPVGGVTPVALATPVRVLLDRALGRYDVVWTAGGTGDTLMPLPWSELPRITGGELVDVTIPK